MFKIFPQPIKYIITHRRNEDGSYSYGYEADDGSFKLETRHADGRVEGKYGYIDIDTGELKVIEYGADMMGFQPEGDLPEGIVVPPPVVGNATYDYDYDTGDYVDPEDPRPDPRVVATDNSVRVLNRARGNSDAPIPGAPTQNRGQNVRAPPTRQREEPRNTFEPTPVPASRTRFQAQPAVQQPSRQSQPQRSRPQVAPQPAAPARQQPAAVDQFTAFQTNFDGDSLASQGLKPFVPQQSQPVQRPPARPTPAPRRPASQSARRPQQNVRALSAAPTRAQQFTREEQQEINEINEIRSNAGAVRSQIPAQPQRTSQRGSGGRRVVNSRPLNAAPTSSNTRSRGRGRGSSRARPSAASSQAINQGSQQSQRLNRPAAQTNSATEDPLAVLKTLQATAGRSPASNVVQGSAPRSRPAKPSSSRPSSSSGGKFASFPARGEAPPTSSLPPRRPQQALQSQPRQPQRAQPTRAQAARAQPTRAQPTRAQPTRAQPTRAFTATQSQSIQPEQPRAQQSQPVRIRTRPAEQQSVGNFQQLVPQRQSRPVIPPQQQVRRPVQQQPSQGAIRALPQQTQTRFLPTPSQPLAPTAAVPTRGFQNQPNVDFDALISEFTGRQTPRPQAPQQPFLAFRPTPAASRPAGRSSAGGSPQFLGRPAAAVPPPQQTPPSPGFGVSGSSFQLNLQVGGQ